MSEQVLHDVKRMFHKRSHRGFGFLDSLECFLLRAFGHRFDRPALPAICQSSFRANATISARFSTPVSPASA